MSTSPIPERNMIDIHMHLIPGVDDGAEDLVMARMMRLRAREQGIHTIWVLMPTGHTTVRPVRNGD